MLNYPGVHAVDTAASEKTSIRIFSFPILDIRKVLAASSRLFFPLNTGTLTCSVSLRPKLGKISISFRYRKRTFVQIYVYIRVKARRAFWKFIHFFLRRMSENARRLSCKNLKALEGERARRDLVPKGRRNVLSNKDKGKRKRNLRDKKMLMSFSA